MRTSLLLMLLAIECATLHSKQSNPREAERLFKHAEKLLAKGELDESAAEFRAAAELDPDNPWWRAQCAMGLEDAGDRSGALEQFRVASRLFPEGSALRLIADGRIAEMLPRKDQTSSTPEGAGASEGAYSVGGNVKPPTCFYEPEPPYSQKARKAKYQGVVVLLATIDTKGNVSFEHVLKSLGMGLDEKALETVAMWKCKPGTRGDVPVPVRVTVEITFRLF
jgi:TonB family protein